VKRFSPLFVYLLWGTILVVSLVVDHQRQRESAAVACAPPAQDSKPAA
jgi:hypothetical protein